MSIGLAVILVSKFVLMPQLGHSIAKRFEQHPAQTATASATSSDAASADLMQCCPPPAFGAGLSPRTRVPVHGEQRVMLEEGRNVGRFARHVTCLMQNERARFCDSGARAGLATLVKTYLGMRRDGLRVAAAAANMPVSQLEAEYRQAMTDIARAGHSATREHARDPLVFDALRSLFDLDQELIGSLSLLVEDGYVTSREFSGFLGLFMPTELEAALQGVVPQRKACN